MNHRNANISLVLVLLFVIVVLLCVVYAAAYRAGKSAVPSSRFYSQGPTIEGLEHLSELVVLRPQIADVQIGENDSLKGSWLIKGDALISIDLSKAEIPSDGKVVEEHRARIVLPQPRVAFARVDHEKTRTWDIEKKKWYYFRSGESDLRDNAMKTAQELIRQAADSPEFLRQAREQAELVIKNFFGALDWKVDVEWKTDK